MFILVLASLFAAVVVYDLYRERHAVAEPELAIRPDRFPLPGQGVFLTHNHLTAVLTGSGMVWLEPDSFAREAAGPEGRIVSVSRSESVRAGDPLFSIEAGENRGLVTAPFSGRIVKQTVDGVLYRPDDLASAVRSMNVGEMAARWWSEERHRLGRFLARIHGEELSLADGGDLVPGYLAHIPVDAFREYETLFLAMGAAKRSSGRR